MPGWRSRPVRDDLTITPSANQIRSIRETKTKALAVEKTFLFRLITAEHPEYEYIPQKHSIHNFTVILPFPYLIAAKRS
jgi:hypothetical protein